jgi:hypothetical protein
VVLNCARQRPALTLLYLRTRQPVTHHSPLPRTPKLVLYSLFAMNVQDVVAQSVLQVAQQLEQQVDQELHKLDNLQDDDIEGLRQKRLLQLRRQQEKQREWVERGHGEYKELNNEKDFFREMKGEERMVCHFYRESFPCKVGVQAIAAASAPASEALPSLR